MRAEQDQEAAPLRFAFAGNRLLVQRENEICRLPASLPAGLAGSILYQRILARPDGGTWQIVELAEEVQAPAGMELGDLRRLYGCLGDALWAAAGHAVQIIHWNRDHRFCGRCGLPMEEKPDELAKICPGCALVNYPRLSPAVIMSVVDGDRILLGRAHRFATGVYSVLAGFVEPGETLEEAVRREVLEETGLTLDAVSYFGSQPWPFPHSLMVAFTCRFAGGTLRINSAELEDARWFHADAMPERLPTRASIARKLIDAFLDAQSGAIAPTD